MSRPPSNPSADCFRGFEKAFKDLQVPRKENLTIEAGEYRQEQVKGMIAGEITDAAWDELVDQARRAAERGEQQYLLLRSHSDLCTDDSRAINNPPVKRVLLRRSRFRSLGRYAGGLTVCSDDHATHRAGLQRVGDTEFVAGMCAKRIMHHQWFRDPVGKYWIEAAGNIDRREFLMLALVVDT
jgi:hypothetical protein